MLKTQTNTDAANRKCVSRQLCNNALELIHNNATDFQTYFVLLPCLMQTVQMKLVIITTPDFFVVEHLIINALFDEGLDALHLRKPGSSAVLFERLISLIKEEYRKRIVIHDHFHLKKKYGLSFHIPRTKREDVARLLFFKDGKLIETGTYPKYYLTIPSEADKLPPTTKVHISFGPSEKIPAISPVP